MKSHFNATSFSLKVLKLKPKIFTLLLTNLNFKKACLKLKWTCYLKTTLAQLCVAVCAISKIEKGKKSSGIRTSFSKSESMNTSLTCIHVHKYLSNLDPKPIKNFRKREKLAITTFTVQSQFVINPNWIGSYCFDSKPQTELVSVFTE